MIDEHTTDKDEREVQIEGLTRDLAQIISTAPAGQRERLRDMAVQLLRDEVEVMRPTTDAPEPRNASNPFGMGIPLFLVGGVMLIMFPPVGLLLCAAAALMMTWGVAATLLMRRHT